MTWIVLTVALIVVFVAQVVTLPNWLLFSVSLALIALFIIKGREPKNDQAR